MPDIFGRSKARHVSLLRVFLIPLIVDVSRQRYLTSHSSGAMARRLRLSLLLVALLTVGLCLTTVEAKKKKARVTTVPVADTVPEDTDSVVKLDGDAPGTTVPADGAVVEKVGGETSEASGPVPNDTEVAEVAEVEEPSETDAPVKVTKKQKKKAAAVSVTEAAADEKGAAIPEEKAASATTAVPADDISSTGNCSKEIALHCHGEPAGKAVLADCITMRIKIDKSGNEENAIVIGNPCKHELRAFKIEMYKDVALDNQMATACKAAITKFCDDDFLYPEAGNIVACLREVNQVDHVSEACKKEVIRAQMDAANDFKMDPQLNELCSKEATRLCKDVTPGEGRVQACLRANRQKLQWDCQAELFRQEVENVDDIRLNVRLFQACLTDKKKFCPDVQPGDARVKDCLDGFRLDPDFSPDCKSEFDKMMERRATDFRLDPSLRKYCKYDISESCYPDAEDITDVANWDAKVIQCLQDYRDELKDPLCRQQVFLLTKRASEDIRFEKPLADACYTDRTTTCKDIPDGMAQVFRCLQDNRDTLKDVCRAALFEQEVRMSEDVNFDYPMKKSCTNEITTLCKDIPPGHGAMIKCLQEKVDTPDMGDECKKEVKREEIRGAEDYRLNYRLNKACIHDVTKLQCFKTCEGALEAGAITCGGKVLKCLSSHKDKIKSEACQKEVFSFEKKEVTDIRLDVPLQVACAPDLEKLCADVSKDHSHTLLCLRTHRDDLSKACKEEELRFSIMESSDIRLTPTLMNACGQEVQSFCRDVPPTDGQAFKCLQGALQMVGMGAACKGEVNLQGARHATNYRLDVRVRKECETDVQSFCAEVDAGQEGHALVLHCMVDKFKNLSGTCQSEVSYAVRMALWQYTKTSALTQECDQTVAAHCESEDAKPIRGAVIGVYGQCLLGHKFEDSTPGCTALINVAAKEGAYVGGKLDELTLAERLDKLTALQIAAKNGGQWSASDTGLVLSGPIAFVAVASLVVVLLGVAYGVYQKYFGPTRNYTMVVKGGDV